MNEAAAGVLRVFLSGGRSLLAQSVRLACEQHGYECVQVLSEADLVPEIANRIPDVFILAEGQVDAAIFQGILRQGALRAVPIVAISDNQPEVGVPVDAYISESASAAEVNEVIRRVVDERESLVFHMRRFDRGAELLTKDANCEWVRSRVGIVGLVSIRTKIAADRLGNDIKHAAQAAHSLLDTLPESRLSLEDLWNLLLFVRVAWTKAEMEVQSDVAKELFRVSLDTTGSRKIILPIDASLQEFVGPLDTRGTPWMPSSADPLLDAVNEVAQNAEEKEALQVLFKSRISENDLERLIRALSRTSR
jgi:hypothetical protein